jgi:hypothetical protein
MTGTVTAYAGEYGVNACQIEPIMQLPEDADAAKAQWQAIEAGQGECHAFWTTVDLRKADGILRLYTNRGRSYHLWKGHN